MASLSHYMSSAALSAHGLLVGRVWNPAVEGPSVVRRDGDSLTTSRKPFPPCAISARRTTPRVLPAR
jgi:hypothetical protein